MNTLSLFNGMSVGRMALESLGFTGTYYSSEVDKYAIKASEALYPDSVQLGDVTKWREWNIDWSSIDLVTGGFPCQAWSMAGKQLGDKDERGMLFWVMLDIMKHVKYHNPKAHFMIENVKMKKEFEQYITTHTENALGHVHKILINSALVSAQNRNRYYWTSFKVEQPEDKGILLRDIIEPVTDDKYILSDKIVKGFHNKKGSFKGRFKPMDADIKEKSFCLTARYYKCGATDPYIKCGSMIGRKINPETGKRDDYNPDIKTQQRIEVRSDEKTGTLTTVQKDNLVIRRDSVVCETFDQWIEKTKNYGGTKEEFNRLLEIQKNENVMSVNDNDRVKAITENDRGYRPHKNDASKSGISELGRILKESAKKTDTITTSHAPKLATNEDVNDLKYRKLTPRECMRLQTIPERHIDTLLSAGISNTQLYKMTGNAWTMEVIKHILKGITKC